MKHTYTDNNGVTHQFDTRAECDAYINTIFPPDPEVVAIEAAKQSKIKRVAFGVGLVEEYQSKNDTLGFESLTRAQRKPINAILRRVFRELQEGYLKDAIEEIRETVNAEFDGTYVRKSRYLKLRNDIHNYLGMPKVANYND